MPVVLSLLTRPGYDEQNLSTLKLLLGVLALGALAWEAIRSAEGRPVARRHRKLAAGALSAAAVIAFFQFFQVGYRDFYHRWDFFVEYLGARYPELDYHHTYECVAVAESQLPNGSAAPDDRPLQDVRTRKLRDLHAHGNNIVETTEILEHPEHCTERFTPARWEAYRQDVAFFRRAMWGNYWRDAQKDQGYSGTPTRMVLARLLIPGRPLTTGWVQALAAIDVVMTAVMFGLIAWAFGWRAMSVTIVFWGVQDLGPFYWLGGSFLRQDWLLCLIASHCLMRRRHFAAAGVVLALGAWLRVLPVFFFAGPAVLLVASVVRRDVDRRLVRFFASATVTSALVLGATAVHPGTHAWPSWLDHMSVHRTSALTTDVGLMPALVHRPENRMQVAKDPRLSDPFARWKEGRQRVRHEIGWLITGVRLVGMGLFVLACLRARRPWIALGLGVVPVVLLPVVPCYFWVALLPIGLLTRARPGLEAPLLLAAVLTQVCHLRLGFFDDRFTAMSVVVVALVAAVLGSFIGPWRRAPSPARPRPSGPAYR